MNKFQVGKTYATASICDSECIYSFVIRRRSDKSVWIDDPRSYPATKAVRRSVYEYEGIEQFKPFGTYSMCAIVGADDLVER